jgi:hypothetical protein
MSKVLKVCVIVYALALAVAGFLNIVIPEQMAGLLGIDSLSDSARMLTLLLGAAFTAAGVWAFIATRDLAKNIIWVKFLITKAALSDVSLVYLVIRDYVQFSDIWWFIAIDFVFIVLCLVFYPWRARQR